MRDSLRCLAVGPARRLPVVLRLVVALASSPVARCHGYARYPHIKPIDINPNSTAKLRGRRLVFSSGQAWKAVAAEAIQLRVASFTSDFGNPGLPQTVSDFLRKPAWTL